MKEGKEGKVLSHKKEIDFLFDKGQSFIFFPMQIIWLVKESEKDMYKLLISIPKKKIKLATKRNLLKRRIREAFRTNKKDLEAHLLNKKIKLHFAIVFQNQKIIEYNIIEQKIKLILNRLIEEI